MPKTLRLMLCGLPALALSLGVPRAAHAQELRISGLLPFEQSAGGSATPAVNGDVLEIPLPDRSLRISPWPSFLPQEFAPQDVEARRQPGPAGPSDRISMRHAAGGQAWLELAAGARQSTPVVGGWKLQHTSRGWWLAQGTKLHFLGEDREHARPVQVPAGRERWCVYLLDAEAPAQRPQIAPEGEPQAAWAALRMSAGQRCGAGAARPQPSWRKVDGVAGPEA